MTGQGPLQKRVLFSDTFAWSITPTKKRGKEKAAALLLVEVCHV